MAITCVSSLNQVVRKNVHKKVTKEFILKKNNNNLICPNCNVHLDRKDVKIWHEYNCGECPYCYKIVKFDSINPRGPRGGRDYYISKNNNIDTAITSEKINSLEDHLKTTTGVENPLSYLKAEEIAQLSKENLDVVHSICGRKWPIGRPSKQFILSRRKILEVI